MPATSSKPEGMWAKILQHPIKFVFLIMLLMATTFLSLAIRDFMKEWHSIWIAQKPAYNVYDEFLDSMILSYLRKQLIISGIDTNGWALRTLDRLHHDIYESALKKIPENDAERVYFWREYEFLPYFYYQDVTGRTDYVPQVLPKAIEAFKQITKDPIKNEYLNKMGKNEIIVNLLNYIQNNNEYLTEQKILGQPLNQFLIERALNKYRDMDLGYIMRSPRAFGKTSPIKFSESLLILLMKQLSPNLDCASPHYQELLEVYKMTCSP